MLASRLSPITDDAAHQTFKATRGPSTTPQIVRLPCGLIAHISSSDARVTSGPPYPSAAEIQRDGVSKYTLIKHGKTVSSLQMTQEYYEVKCTRCHGSIEAAETHQKSVRGGARASGLSHCLTTSPTYTVIRDRRNPNPARMSVSSISLITPQNTPSGFGSAALASITGAASIS